MAKRFEGFTVIALVVFGLLPEVFAAENTSTFTFFSGGKKVEGYVALPGAHPRALLLYFHRAIENRDAVLEWEKLVGPRGYAVAGFTATKGPDVLQDAKQALSSLRNRKDLASLRVFTMGASMGTRAAAGLFANDSTVKGLVLIVPPDLDLCASLQKASGRPVFIVEAEKDEVAEMQPKAILKCAPKNAGYFLLPDATHRFPPSLVSSKIADWLDKIK